MTDLFSKAKPIWLSDREKDVHLRVQFKTVIRKSNLAKVKIATSGMYQLFVNGSFVAYGPARAGKNYFRLDEIDVADKLIKDENVLIIEVVGYNANSFAIQNQTSFLQAEVVTENGVSAFTGGGFTARVNPNYYRKTQRYSFQRPMVESYHIESVNYDFFTNIGLNGEEEISVLESRNIIERLAPYPAYGKIKAEQKGGGEVAHIVGKKPWRDKAIWGIGEQLVGFPEDELEVLVTDDCTDMEFSPCATVTDNHLKTDRYLVYKLPYESSGFMTATVNCKEDTRLYFLFDEICKDDGTVDYLRMGCANVIRYDLCKGVHNLQLFEVYSMQYIQIVAAKGECTIEAVGMTEYKHPPIKIPKLENERLQKIANAAAETYRQNAVDIFMDCPSRERAGWLCDSFFTARAEYYATGKSLVEKSFLQNFLHEDCYENLPNGMFPMCYPADFYDKNFIPQWSLWLVLELREYLARSNDTTLVNHFRKKIYELIKYFLSFENEDGLIEKLDGWQFVEWSMANKLVNDVNYPTNMLYSAALKAASELYDDKELLEKSERIKREVIKQSFNGSFFTDNAVRENGVLRSTGEITEACQYYAFFLGIATAETHTDLFKTLINDFGPKREKTKKWEYVHPAAPFIGYFLRLDILAQNGIYGEMAENIDGYYYDMASATGTLWERAQLKTSCNHGFSSYILCWLDIIAKKGE